MNTAINTPRYNTIKRMHMTEIELGNQLLSFKSRLWRYIETTPSHSINDSYVTYLETNITELKSMLKPVAKVG